MPILSKVLCPAFGTGIAFCKAGPFCKEDARADDDATDPCIGGGCEAALLGVAGEVIFDEVAAIETDMLGVAWMGTNK
jgi:hypothetical protein